MSRILFMHFARTILKLGLLPHACVREMKGCIYESDGIKHDEPIAIPIVSDCQSEAHMEREVKDWLFR